jgi:hypothetical protein
MTNGAAATEQNLAEWTRSNRLRVLLVLSTAVLAAAVATVATLAAGSSWVGQSVVTFEQPGITFSAEAGLESIQLLGAAAPTFAERARSDDVAATVAEALDRDDVTEVRDRIGAVVLPDTVAVRLRFRADDQAEAERATTALTDAFITHIEGLPTGAAASLDAQVLRSPETIDQRPSLLRSVLIAGLVGLLLGAVAATVVARA